MALPQNERMHSRTIVGSLPSHFKISGYLNKYQAVGQVSPRICNAR